MFKIVSEYNDKVVILDTYDNTLDVITNEFCSDIKNLLTIEYAVNFRNREINEYKVLVGYNKNGTPLNIIVMEYSFIKSGVDEDLIKELKIIVEDRG